MDQPQAGNREKDQKIKLEAEVEELEEEEELALEQERAGAVQSQGAGFERNKGKVFCFLAILMRSFFFCLVLPSFTTRELENGKIFC